MIHVLKSFLRYCTFFIPLYNILYISEAKLLQYLGPLEKNEYVIEKYFMLVDEGKKKTSLKDHLYYTVTPPYAFLIRVQRNGIFVASQSAQFLNHFKI